MNIKLPALSLVALVGVSGCGKSTFARQHFKPTEVVSSDFCRGLVSDDENNQEATHDAFELLHTIAGTRLRGGRLTVVDATSVQPDDRKPLVKLARDHDCLCVAIVFLLPESLCIERNRSRPDRSFGAGVVLRQSRLLRSGLRGLEKEGFKQQYFLRSAADVEAVTIERVPLWTDRRRESGPFDIIGDIHGCGDELLDLLGKLGYTEAGHPQGRRAVFLGDLVDRGPGIPLVLRTVMRMVAGGQALCISGNHEAKLLRKLQGRNVQMTHGLTQSVEQLAAEGEAFQAEVAAFLDSLISHYVLDGGKLVVAHAGMKEAYQGRASGRVKQFSLFGETTGETDRFGLPVRYNWAADYRGQAFVVYGHTPVLEAEWLNRTICIDTGCVFGGQLTSLRYPEMELVSVPARATWYEPVRPLAPSLDSGLTAQQEYDDLLDLEEVSGKLVLQPSLAHNISIAPSQTAAALEVMSRWAVDPHWLIYLPPTMSPSETSAHADWLEHPDEAFQYYRTVGIRQVMCERKHMGSRAVLVLCRDEAAARRRFGRVDGIGVCYTRTGRPFFNDRATATAVLERMCRALEPFWHRFETDWFCLDAELMPWSAKAQQLVRDQYAPVSTAGRVLLETARDALVGNPLQTAVQERLQQVVRYEAAWQGYCWPVNGLDDYRLAPFHLLASEGQVHDTRSNAWHMEILAELAARDPDWLVATPCREVDVEDENSMAAACEWWEAATLAGAEGMVVKPLEFVARRANQLVQPALKCRGREYLRIIYGPEYDRAENLSRLKRRGLGRKRALALQEFALGLEALHRFVRREPLRRIHQCVFGVLALESEPVDPRL